MASGRHNHQLHHLHTSALFCAFPRPHGRSKAVRSSLPFLHRGHKCKKTDVTPGCAQLHTPFEGHKRKIRRYWPVVRSSHTDSPSTQTKESLKNGHSYTARTQRSPPPLSHKLKKRLYLPVCAQQHIPPKATTHKKQAQCRVVRKSGRTKGLHSRKRKANRWKRDHNHPSPSRTPTPRPAPKETNLKATTPPRGL